MMRWPASRLRLSLTLSAQVTGMHMFQSSGRRRPRLKNLEKLSYSQKLSRLGTRLLDPEWRRYGMLLLAGKFLGLACIALLVLLINVVPSLLSGTVRVSLRQAPRPRPQRSRRPRPQRRRRQPRSCLLT